MASNDVDISTADESESTKIWVGNFPYGTTETDLLTLFNTYNVLKIDIVNATEAGKTASAILYVEKGELAVRQMDGFNFKGRPLGVRIANKMTTDRKANQNKLEKCRILAQQLIPMLDQVLDSCQYCHSIKSMMNELSWALRDDSATFTQTMPLPPNHQQHTTTNLFPGVGEFTNQAPGYTMQRPMISNRPRQIMQNGGRGGGDVGHRW